MTQHIDPATETRRQAELELRYHEDGRHDPAHPLHSLYTGLFAESAPPTEGAA